MKIICGDKGFADASTCCYHLVDIFFTRAFLLTVSWSGGSRTENKKLPLKKYFNTLSVFNTLVRLASNDFDEHKSKEFFITVLKNSKKRTERTSTKKVYVHKKIIYSPQEKIFASDEDDAISDDGNIIDQIDDVVLDKTEFVLSN